MPALQYGLQQPAPFNAPSLAGAGGTSWIVTARLKFKFGLRNPEAGWGWDRRSLAFERPPLPARLGPSPGNLGPNPATTSSEDIDTARSRCPRCRHQPRRDFPLICTDSPSPESLA